MKTIHPLGFLAILLLTSACAGTPPLTLPSAGDLQIEATQAMRIESQGHTQEAIVQLALLPTQMQAIATTPQGQTLIKASLDNQGKILAETPPWMRGRGPDPATILRDIQFALWPADALRAQAWEVKESPQNDTRVISLNHIEWARIDYEGSRKAPQHIKIMRSNGLYTIHLKTLEWIPL
ncbi:hypothetical protein HDN1F_24770 [gamma proteobacterium HdN1]|nr:hypothetical protein HDN1F_24770 [gamma proteobacterium HdN1]